MKRRHFFQNAGALSAGLALGVSDGLLAAQPKADYNKNPFIIGVNGHKITYNIPDLSQKVTASVKMQEMLPFKYFSIFKDLLCTCN